ncbi:protein GAMETE EXPRESSED 1-like [Alnus glutinosa]|uniref:protein GAMETE EXPRESSED 1-like n=1 Tax=Alnus glutinosa TaxID=3517 RepID=UPI002D77BB6D|nr:protein GAMETE EXPRESSED 1-like [Alnus glutinosa]
MGQYKFLLFLLVLLSLSKSGMSWTWFSAKKQSSEDPQETLRISGDVMADFSMDALSDEKGMERVNNARRKLTGLKSCWYDAYQGLFAKCSDITGDDNEGRKRFAWDLSNCFQKDSGRPSFPPCLASSPMKACLEKVDNNAIHTYRQFFIETNSICNQLQSTFFRLQTEKLVNHLVKSADYAEEKLETIEEKSEHLLQGSKDIHDSLSKIGQQTQQVAQTSENVNNQIKGVLKQSEAVFEQSEKITASQSELQKGQEKMKIKLEEGMTIIHESYNNLGKEIDNLQNETVEIENKISKVGDSMYTKMNKLQSKADDIENIAGISLDKQKQLIEGQSEALQGLQSLAKFQSQALEESRVILQQLAKFGHEQQEELLRRQGQLQQANDHLVENSKSILAAQEAFEQKQATMFLALDKLSALHTALLLESRLIKACFVYSISVFVIYMFTSTKSTYTVRPRLYIGLCATFLIEFAVLRFVTNGIEQQTWMVNLVRSLFAGLALIQILHAIFTYRDFERLNYEMLQDLMNKVKSWDSDGDEDWSQWIDSDVPDGVDNLQDPDYNPPKEEGIGENSYVTSSATRKYNLRSRCH